MDFKCFRFSTLALSLGAFLALSNSTMAAEKPCALLTAKDFNGDETMIREVCKRQALQGSSSAQSILGSSYQVPFLGPRDDKEAFKWCSMADAHGEKGNLGCMFTAYYEGRGTSQDLTEAYKYLILAIENDCVSCAPDTIGAITLNGHLKIRSHLDSTLPNSVILEAKRRAAKWNELHGYKN